VGWLVELLSYLHDQPVQFMFMAAQEESHKRAPTFNSSRMRANAAMILRSTSEKWHAGKSSGEHPPTHWRNRLSSQAKLEAFH